MLFHNIKYTFLSMIRTKEVIFWSLVFPLALATFMYLAFGKINEVTENLETIDVAVVESVQNEMFDKILVEVSNGESPLLNPMKMNIQDAVSALDSKEVDGIIHVDDTISLSVRENGLNATILSSFVDRYLQNEATLTQIAKNNPLALNSAIEALSDDTSYFKEEKLTDGNTDNLSNYFYAVFAMSCLFASFTGISSMFSIQGNLSPLGQRRCVAPTKKLHVVLTLFLTNEIVQFAIELITFAYMSLVLGIDLSNKYPALFLLLFVASSFGLTMGMFIGSLKKPVTEGAKMGIGVAISMALSVMADLCVSGLMNTIEHTVPIINRLNPAALISDSFYALNTYSDYSRYTSNMVNLSAMTLILFTLTILTVRRNRYASI
ncbi:MAG: ABC transporter permease [Lachnospiraceae bacterium]|nr:ABC transporter permease [Lachnoclostridium sp.]MDY2599869.1 ABC transporter permease [Lachnospiraceae bacterium]